MSQTDRHSTFVMYDEDRNRFTMGFKFYHQFQLAPVQQGSRGRRSEPAHPVLTRRCGQGLLVATTFVHGSTQPESFLVTEPLKPPSVFL
jgi:hypothetical protein